MAKIGAMKAMRKTIYALDRAGALALLARADVVHVATTDAEGAPVLRTVNAVVVGDVLAFHGAPAGEKEGALGRQAVVQAEHVVAAVPSYFVDAERACPASTYYQSAQVHGTLEPIEAPERKAEVLAALMAKYQPEGGHVPIDAAHPLYRKAIAGVRVLGVPLAHVSGKSKLGQNRSPEELGRILAGLWARGAEGDAEAIEAIRVANEARLADAPVPAFLQAPAGVRLSVALRAGDDEIAARMLEGQYWLLGVPLADVARSHRASAAWVGARDAGTGRLVGFARGTSDTRVGWVYDVFVDPAHRGRGVAKALVGLLLDHPRLRGVRAVRLGTRDAAPLYAQLGFRDVRDVPARAGVIEMIRLAAR